MALYHKWDVKNDFPYVLQFFSLIFDGLGSVYRINIAEITMTMTMTRKARYNASSLVLVFESWGVS